MISRWEEASQDCDTAATLKEAYLSREVLPNVIGEHWPSPCVDLVLALSAFICPLMGEKMKLNQLSPRARKGKEQMFAANAIQHYSRIIHLFDTAIEALEKPDTWRVSSPDVACADPISIGSTSTDSSVERFYEEYERSRRRLAESRSSSPDRGSEDSSETSSISGSSTRSLKRTYDGDADHQHSSKRPKSSRSSSSESESDNGSVSPSSSITEAPPRRATRRSARIPT